MDEKTLASIAVSDEMMLRILCAAYGVSSERGIDLNDPETAAPLMVGALRFAAGIAQAYELSRKQFAMRAAEYYDTPLAVARGDEPGVRRWIEHFRQTYGARIPFAFVPRVDGDSTH